MNTHIVFSFTVFFSINDEENIVFITMIRIIKLTWNVKLTYVFKYHIKNKREHCSLLTKEWWAKFLTYATISKQKYCKKDTTSKKTKETSKILFNCFRKLGLSFVDFFRIQRCPLHCLIFLSQKQLYLNIISRHFQILRSHSTCMKNLRFL